MLLGSVLGVARSGLFARGLHWGSGTDLRVPSSAVKALCSRPPLEACERGANGRRHPNGVRIHATH